MGIGETLGKPRDAMIQAKVNLPSGRAAPAPRAEDNCPVPSVPPAQIGLRLCLSQGQTLVVAVIAASMV